MDKRELAEILNNIATMLELKGDNPFRIRAYRNGARAIEMTRDDIDILLKEDRLKDIRGIGKGLQGQITELVETGKLDFYDELRAELPQGLFEILRIPGLGPKKVKALYENLGITNIGELEYACLENRLLTLKGFGQRSQEAILEGIGHLQKYRGQHLMSTGQIYGQQILRELKKHNPIIRGSLAGSIRRKNETIKDIDIICSCEDEDREAIMDYFTSLSGLDKVIGRGETKSSIMLDIGVNVDLRLVKNREYPYALHHFTGSKEHNTAIRHRAKAMGLKINEYGIFRDGKIIEIENEKDFYGVLGLQYIPPEIRENQGEIQLAETNSIARLVEVKDIQGVLHIHSNYSDGANSIEDMVKAAIERGFKYLGISDHSKTAFYANGLKEEAIMEQHGEIETLKKAYPQITIFKGIESDILPDGSLDYDDNILQTFDYVIASVHSHFNMDRESMTQRLVRATENEFVTILGHPTGRLLLSREEYDLDLEELIRSCGKNQVAIEINSNPHRLDLDWRMCQYAKAHGVKISIEPDAHRIEGIDDIVYGVGIARKGMLTADDIINTYDVQDIQRFFKCK